MPLTAILRSASPFLAVDRHAIVADAAVYEARPQQSNVISGRFVVAKRILLIDSKLFLHRLNHFLGDDGGCCPVRQVHMVLFWSPVRSAINNYIFITDYLAHIDRVGKDVIDGCRVPERCNFFALTFSPKGGYRNMHIG